MWLMTNILDSTAAEQKCLTGWHWLPYAVIPTDQLAADGMFTHWALLSFQFCTYLHHHF